MSSSSISSPSASPSRLLSKDIFDVCKPIKEQLEAMQMLYGEESIFNLTAPVSWKNLRKIFIEKFCQVLAALEELEKIKILYDEEHQKCSEFETSVEKLEKELKHKRDENMRLKQVCWVFVRHSLVVSHKLGSFQTIYKLLF